MFNEVEKVVARELVETPEVVEYGVFSKRIENKYGIHINPHFGFRKIFDKISTKCHELGLPLLSGLVVSKKLKHPGEGFFTMYCRLMGEDINDYKGLDYDAFVNKTGNNVVADILNCKDWNILLREIGA